MIGLLTHFREVAKAQAEVLEPQLIGHIRAGYEVGSVPTYLWYRPTGFEAFCGHDMPTGGPWVVMLVIPSVVEGLIAEGHLIRKPEPRPESP